MGTILAAVDMSEVTERVVEQGAALARALDRPLYILHVEAPNPEFVGYEVGPEYIRDNVAKTVSRHHETLLALRERYKEAGLEVHALVIQGITADKIKEEQKRLDADYLVLGSHGHGALYHMLLGSVSEAVLRDATCPVVIVPSNQKEQE